MNKRGATFSFFPFIFGEEHQCQTMAGDITFEKCRHEIYRAHLVDPVDLECGIWSGALSVAAINCQKIVCIR